MMPSDNELRAHEYARKRNDRLVRLRNEYSDIQKILDDVDNQVDGPDDFRLLKRIGGRDVSNWKATDKQVRVERLRFREPALEREIAKIAAEIDSDKRARGFYGGPMIHPDPTPQRF